MGGFPPLEDRGPTSCGSASYLPVCAMNHQSTLLVVCTGNVCRSPMGAALLAKAFPEVRIESAGTSALVGHPAPPHAIEVMQEIGLDLANHRGAQVTPESLRAASLVLVAASTHKEQLEARFPWVRGRVYRIGQWLGHDIEDPWQRDLETFLRVRCALELAIESWRGRVEELTR